MIIEQTDSVELEVPPLIPAPAQPAEWPAWRAWLARWRTHIRQALSYEDALYADQAFQGKYRTTHYWPHQPFRRLMYIEERA